MKSVYIAAPMFSQAELQYNEMVATQIEKIGYNVFLPQRSGYKFIELLKEMSPAEARKKIFIKDYTAVQNTDILVIILDGRTIDEGACVELGIGYTLGKVCYGLKSDPRTMMNGQINPMISECLSGIYTHLNDLLLTLREQL